MSGREDSSERTLQRLFETFKRFDPYLDLTRVILAYITMFISVWIIVSLFADIPAPGVVDATPKHPEAALFILSFLLLLTSKDAAKWYKHRLREGA